MSGGTAARPAVFLDRDGVINENRADYVKSWEEFAFLPGALEAMRTLSSRYEVVVVTNQSAIGRGLMTRAAVEQIHQRMCDCVQQHHGRIRAVLYCPHHPREECGCRKPRPGLLLAAAQEFHLDLRRCWMVGDAVSDMQAALRAGVSPVLVLTGRGRDQQKLLDAGSRERMVIQPDLPAAVNWMLHCGHPREADAA